MVASSPVHAKRALASPFDPRTVRHVSGNGRGDGPCHKQKGIEGLKEWGSESETHTYWSRSTSNITNITGILHIPELCLEYTHAVLQAPSVCRSPYNCCRRLRQSSGSGLVVSTLCVCASMVAWNHAPEPCCHALMPKYEVVLPS